MGTLLESARGYVDAGGLSTYYEAVGTGDPLVMLHGGFTPVETLGGLTALFTDAYRVYSPERRGQGRMPDIPGPITYEIMAEDTIAFIDALGLGPVHVVGWSDGANVGLITALRRPDLVRKLVLIGTAEHVSGCTPIAQAMLPQLTAEQLPPMLIQAYAELSPDGPEHLAVVVEKLAPALAVTSVRLPDLARVAAPTLVMAADDDMVSIAHLEAMRDALPDGQVAVVPGTSHALPLEKPELTARLIRDFLADVQVTRLMPMR